MNSNLAALEVFRTCTIGQLIEALQQAPSDARIDSLFRDPWTKNTVMVVAHPSFGSVPEGECIPRLDTRRGSP